MSIYLGQLGRLVELKCPASLQVTPAERYTFQETLEGRNKAQVRPVGRRAWSLATSDATTPRDQGAIMSFAVGEWGNGPFVFVSADAPVTNMLSPDAASCDPSHLYGSTNSAGGPMQVGNEWAGRSFTNSDPSFLLWFSRELVPVLPGVPVTASGLVRGAGAAVRVQFYDAADTAISTVTSSVQATAGTAVRSHVTVDSPPAGAVSCSVMATNASQGAHPAITWTDSLFDWADGQGCPKAVLHGASRSIVLASRDPRGGRYSNVSFTVTEVG